MPKVVICKSEFISRLARLRAKMQDLGLDAMFVYGDEYRKENLRYVSNFWPLFERGAFVLGLEREPIILCAPEGELLCREMSVWDDVRVVPDFLCVTVPDTIDYPLVHYTDFRQIANELKQHQPVRRMGVVGLDAMSAALTKTVQDAFDVELVDCNSVLFELRLVKSQFEINSLTEVARIADAAYETLMQADLVGMTEIQAAVIIEGAARREGAEHIIFNVFGSGERTHTIIGRPTDKIIEDGDMIMCALAVQYNGYVATCEMPFAAGTPTSATKKVIDVLIAAALAGYPELRPGNPMKNFVQAVKKVFRE